MKKLIVIIAFTFFINLPVYSWIYPDGGINIDKWEHNKEVEIAWRFTVDTLAPTADTTIFEVVTIAKLDSVTIDLWDAKNSRYINIVTNYVDTNNVYNWTIPDSEYEVITGDFSTINNQSKYWGMKGRVYKRNQIHFTDEESNLDYNLDARYINGKVNTKLLLEMGDF